METREKKSGRRYGYTTGTCAAAASRAAAFMLITGQEIDRIELHWQAAEGRIMDVVFPLEEIERKKEFVSCAVRKDAGDDPDITDGLLIYSKVSRLPESAEKKPELHREEASVNTGEKPGSEGENSRGAGEADGQISLENAESLSELEDENVIIPFRWDRVADAFSPRSAQQSPGGNFISFAESGDFTDAELAVMEDLFQAAGGPVAEADGLPGPEDAAAGAGEEERYLILGGKGIGVVTKPGLDQPVGEAAINSGPRRMIRSAVSQICDSCEYEGRLQIEISAPGGESLALKTFNPRLGIEGGISILGTTGIVEVMSGRAVAETVRAEVRVRAAASKVLALVPGNTGAAFVKKELLIPGEKLVMMSNYPGDAIDEAKENGVERILLAGSLGKMIKLAGGIFHTHSRDADSRMDIMIRCALKAGAPLRVLRGLDRCVTTEAAVGLLEERSFLDPVIERVLERALSYARQRAGGMEVEMILLRNSGEVLAFSEEAFSVMEERG